VRLSARRIVMFMTIILCFTVSFEDECRSQAANATCDSELTDDDARIRECNKIIRKNKRSSAAYNNRGRAYMKKGITDKAMADYNKAIQLDYKNSSAHNNRGMLLSDALNDYDAAISEFNKSIELTPDEPTIYFNRGLASERKGDLKQALSDFKMFVELAPSDADGQKALERVKAAVEGAESRKTEEQR
jgi:tetratricopeptide (TPR) repeat protein